MGAATAEVMTKERAIELMRIVNSFAFYEMGLVDAPKKLPIDVSLLELCVALEIVEKNGVTQNEDGSTTHMMRPDQRLIAAAYTATHYRASDQSDVDIIVRMPPGGLFPRGTVLVHIEVPDGKSDDDE